MLCICICKSHTDASLVKLSRNSKKWTVSVRHTCEGLSAHIFSRLTDCIYPVKVRSATAQKHSMIAFILIFAPPPTHTQMNVIYLHVIFAAGGFCLCVCEQIKCRSDFIIPVLTWAVSYFIVQTHQVKPQLTRIQIITQAPRSLEIKPKAWYRLEQWSNHKGCDCH